MASQKKDINVFIEEIAYPMAKEECKEKYTKWSNQYEQDMPECGYKAPEETAKRFQELNIPKESKILECGAGTGLLGQALIKMGYTDLDALDGCEKMLEQAKKKNIYKNTYISYVGPDQELPVGRVYDALVMVGVFCPGHFPMAIGTFKQLLGPVKKGGIMAWGMSNPDRFAERDEAYANKGFNKILDCLVERGLVEILPDHPKIIVNYYKGEDGFFYAVRKH